MPSQERRTISLIGMPGAGKSTVGVLLAKLAGLGFVDTDLEIQSRERATLQQIIDARGYEALRAIEAQVLAELHLAGRVIATGGSAVYSAASMARLAAAGPVVYLRADIETLEERINAHRERGIASPPDQDLEAIFLERTPLYEAAADITIDADDGVPATQAAAILTALAPV